MFLAKQGLPFRGDFESIQSKKNPGNFLALLKDYATTDKILFDHLNSSRAKNATYISPSTQNDIINVIGCDYNPIGYCLRGEGSLLLFCSG